MPGLSGFAGGGGGGGDQQDSGWVARRVQAIAATNPELASDPSALLAMATDTGISDDRLVPAADNVTGDLSLKNTIDAYRALPVSEQVKQWNSLFTTQQQQTLQAAGYNPTGLNTPGGGLLALGQLGLTQDGNAGIGAVTNRVTNAWDWSKQQLSAVTPDQIEDPLNTVRKDGIGAGASMALKGLNYPFSQVSHGINTALLQASRQDAGGSFFTGWGDAWRTAGGDQNFRQQAVNKAHDLLGGDADLYAAAAAQANGQDLIDYVKDRYDLDDQTPELAAKYGEVVSKLQGLKDPEAFGAAVKTLAFNRASFGMDVANMLGVKPGTKQFAYTSAGADLALAMKADPLLVFGKLHAAQSIRKWSVLYRGGLDVGEAAKGFEAARGLNPLLKGIDSFRTEQSVVRKFDDTAKLYRRWKDTGDQVAFRQLIHGSGRPFASSLPALGAWEAEGNTVASADDLFRWFQDAGEAGGLVPLSQGAFRRARETSITLPRYTRAGEAFSRVKLAAVDRIDLAADKPKIIAEYNRLGAGILAQHLSPDQIRAVQDGEFLNLGDKIFGPAARAAKKMTTQVRRNQKYLFLDDSPEFLGEMERWVDEGQIAGQSFVTRTKTLSDMLAAPNVEQRRLLASSYMQDMAEASGMLRSESGQEFWAKFLDHSNQAYTFDGWDKIGASRRAAILPTMQTSSAIAVPSFLDLANSVAQTTATQLFSKINSDGVATALSRFWKVPVLLRIGFVPRAAGEELLTFLLSRPGEYGDYVRANIAAGEGTLAPLKPFFLPLKATSKALHFIAPSTGRTIEDASTFFGKMLSDPVRWWAGRGANPQLVGALKDWSQFEHLKTLGMGNAEIDDALRELGKDPFMVRNMVEGFSDVSAKRHGLVAQAAEGAPKPPRGATLVGPRGEETHLERFVDTSNYVAYRNPSASQADAQALADAGGVKMADSLDDAFPAMFIHRNEELWRESATRNALEELSRRYVGPRVTREVEAASGKTFAEVRSTWKDVDPDVAKQIKAVFLKDRIDPVAVDQLAAKVKREPKAKAVVEALRHEGVSQNTRAALLGDLRDDRLVYDRSRAQEMFKGRLASELQDPANRDSVEQMVRAFQDSQGRQVATAVADGQTPLYSITADAATNRELSRALAGAGGKKPNPGDWPVVQGSRDFPSFAQHWDAFHDGRNQDVLDLVGSYFDGGAASAPMSAWASHDYRRAEAMKNALEEQYNLKGRLGVGHVAVDSKAAREGIGVPLAPDVVHRIEGGAATDLYNLGPGSMPLVEPLSDGQTVDWARAVDDQTVASLIRLSDEDPEAYRRLIDAAQSDFHLNHQTIPGGQGYRNPAAMSREAFLAEPEQAVLDRAGQALNRHQARTLDPDLYAGKAWDHGIAAVDYAEHPDYLRALGEDLRHLGRDDLGTQANEPAERLLGADRPHASVVDGSVVAPDPGDYGAVVRDVAAQQEALHAQWLDLKLRDTVPGIPADANPTEYLRAHAAEMYDDIAHGGAPSLERLIDSLPDSEKPLGEALLGSLSKFRGETRTAALQRAVLDPVAWAHGDPAPAWARTVADELHLTHSGQIGGSLEQVLARRSSLPTPGVLPGDLFDDWANIIGQHVDRMLFTPDGELLHSITQPALQGYTGTDVLARVDHRDLPAAILAPSEMLRAQKPLSVGGRFDAFAGKGFQWIGGHIDSMSRKPLYVSNYVRESSVNKYLRAALIDPEWRGAAEEVLGGDLNGVRDVWRMIDDADHSALNARATQARFEKGVAKVSDQLLGEGKLDDLKPTIDRLLALSPEERVTVGRHFTNLDHADRVVASSAMTRAVTASVPFIDDHAVRSQYASYMRNLQPFWFAEEQFYKRWIRTVAMRPDAIQRGQQYMMGLRHAGVVHKDENGNEVFTYPGSAEGLSVLTSILGKVGVQANMPVDMALTGNVKRVLPGIGNFGLPSASPLITVPTGALAALLPEANGLDDGVSGIGKNRSIVDRVVPTSWGKIWAAATHDPEKDPQMASAMFQAVQYLSATHPEDVPDGTDPAKTQQFFDRARSWARIQLGYRAAFGFIGPASPTNALDDNGLNDEARKLIGSLGMEDGLAELVRRHPDYTPFDLQAEGVSQTKVPSRASLPATQTATAWLQDNEGLAKSYPNAGLFLLPPPDATEKFDIEAYYFQMANDYRVRRSLDDTWREIKFRQDAGKYFDTNDHLDLVEAATQTSGGRAAVKAARSAFNDQYLATHPVFADKLQASETAEQRQRTISEMDRMMANPESLPQGETTKKVRLMWESWQNTQASLDKRKYDQTARGSAQKKAIKAALLSWGDAYARQNPEVRGLWERVYKPEVGGS